MSRDQDNMRPSSSMVKRVEIQPDDNVSEIYNKSIYSQNNADLKGVNVQQQQQHKYQLNQQHNITVQIIRDSLSRPQLLSQRMDNCKPQWLSTSHANLKSDSVTPTLSRKSWSRISCTNKNKRLQSLNQHLNLRNLISRNIRLLSHLTSQHTQGRQQCLTRTLTLTSFRCWLWLQTWNGKQSYYVSRQ